MKKVLSIYVNLQDRELNLPKYLNEIPFIISICPASLSGIAYRPGTPGITLSKKGIREVKELLDRGCILGQRGHTGVCPNQYTHEDGTDRWHENYCPYNPNFSLEQQLELMETGKWILEEQLGSTPKVYAPTNHLFDNTTLRIAKVLGYEFVMDQNHIGALPLYSAGFSLGNLTVIPEARLTDDLAEKSIGVYGAVNVKVDKQTSKIIKKLIEENEFVLPSQIKPTLVRDTLREPLAKTRLGNLLKANEIKKRISKFERDLRLVEEKNK